MIRLHPVRVIDGGDVMEMIVQAELVHSGADHNPNIATGMILAIFIEELQERLIAVTNVGSFPG